MSLRGHDAMRAFAGMMATAPEGAPLVIGECWAPDRGWNVMMTMGEESLGLLIITANQARKLAEIFDKWLRQHRGNATAAELKWVPETLRTSASVAERKRKSGEVPPNAALHMPAAGRA